MWGDMYLKHVLMPYLEDDCEKVITYINEHPVSSFFSRLPNWVTSMMKDDHGNISNEKLSMPQFLYLLVRVIAGGSDTVVAVNPAPNPFKDTGAFLGDITKTEYIRAAKSIRDFIKAQNRLPNYVTVKVTYDSNLVTKQISMPSMTLLFVNIINQLAATQSYPGNLAIMHCI